MKGLVYGNDVVVFADVVVVSRLVDVVGANGLNSCSSILSLHFGGPPLCFHVVSLRHRAIPEPTSVNPGEQENLQRWRTRLCSVAQLAGVTWTVRTV